LKFSRIASGTGMMGFSMGRTGVGIRGSSCFANEDTLDDTDCGDSISDGDALYTTTCTA
jgi:hypothetical protein